MRIAVRTDASVAIGSGHLARCLTLADQLAGDGAEVTVLARGGTPVIYDAVTARGHALVLLDHTADDGVRDFALGREVANGNGPAHAHWLPVSQDVDARQCRARLAAAAPGPVDWLIVDHYALDRRWETAMRPVATRILVIDDLADRAHDCDLLLDQNLKPMAGDCYRPLMSAQANALFGPSFALLRPEFTTARATLRQRDGQVRRMLVMFGGTDPTNETMKTLDALEALERTEIAVDVVVGAACPNADRIATRVAARRTDGWQFWKQAQNMAGLMAEADLAIGAAGSATWERCCLGLPTIAIAVADNQRMGLMALDGAGAALSLGASEAITSEDIRAAIATLLRSPDVVRGMGERAAALVDGRGTARVVQAMRAAMEGNRDRLTLRPATGDDCARLLAWRNHPATRANSNSRHEIGEAEHEAWLARVLADPDHVVLIGERDGQPIGVVRFVVRGAEAVVSIALDPVVQGQGHAAPLLRLSAERLARERPAITTVLAEILDGNLASQRAFEAAGYVRDPGRIDPARYRLDLASHH